jgi:hypothetical protein
VAKKPHIQRILQAARDNRYPKAALALRLLARLVVIDAPVDHVPLAP